MCISKNKVPTQKFSERFDSDGYWGCMEVTEKLQDSHLINNAVVIIKIDWKDTRFSCEIQDKSPLSEDDRSALNKELAAQTDGMEFLHQNGILV